MMLKELRDAVTEPKLGLTQERICLSQAKTCLTQAKFCPNSAKKSPNSNFRRVVVSARNKSAEKKTLNMTCASLVNYSSRNQKQCKLKNLYVFKHTQCM